MSVTLSVDESGKPPPFPPTANEFYIGIAIPPLARHSLHFECPLSRGFKHLTMAMTATNDLAAPPTITEILKGSEYALYSAARRRGLPCWSQLLLSDD